MLTEVHCLYFNNCACVCDLLLCVFVSDTGSSLFMSGMAVNIHSDYILRSLRQQSDAADMSYRIPRGMSVCVCVHCMFEYVSCVCMCVRVCRWLV